MTLVERVDQLIEELQQIRAELAESKREDEQADQRLRGCTPDQGLHMLAKAWWQVEYQKVQCEELLKDGSLQRAIDATTENAPGRSKQQSFRLLGAQGRVAPEQIDFETERGLEAAVAQRWPVAHRDDLTKLPWCAIAGYQVPLFDEASKRGWGSIDLLGITNLGRPVVIELKKAENREPPLRPLLEAAAYAVAIQKSWDVLRLEIRNLLDGEDAWADLPGGDEGRLGEIPIVLAAPGNYWDHWKKAGCAFRHAKNAYRELTGRFKEHGYPVFHVRLALNKPNRRVESAESFDFPGD